jgi:hypothetical protein
MLRKQVVIFFLDLRINIYILSSTLASDHILKRKKRPKMERKKKRKRGKTALGKYIKEWK